MKSIYYRQPYQSILVHQIKKPFNEAMATLTDPSSSKLSKVRAVDKLRRLVPVVNSLPEPTLENVIHHNSRILVRIRNEFFRRLYGLPSRLPFLKALFNFPIIIVETDFYRPFVDWVGWKIKQSDWQPPSPGQPDHHYWKSETD